MSDKSNTVMCGILAFYKSDLPGGISIAIFNADTNLTPGFASSAAIYENGWKKAGAKKRVELVEFYFNQLKYYGSKSCDERTLAENWILAMNIWFLERYRFLEPDDSNGCIFQHIERPTHH
jgi:hypothetical protein